MNEIKNYGVSTHQTDTFEIGNILQSNVDLVNGNLTVDVNEFAWQGLRLPVTIRHFYNSDLANYQYTENSSKLPLVANFSAMKIGYGWRINFMQSIMDDGDDFFYTDENGNVTRFIATEQSHIFISEENNGDVYNAETETLSIGEDTYTFDNGRLCEIKDGYNNRILITYSQNRITEIQDGAGRSFAFAYNDNGFLTSITAPDGSIIGYEYSGDSLERIIFPDGKIIAFGWGDNPKINVTALLDSQGSPVHEISYEYNDERISQIEEYGVIKNYYYSEAERITSIKTVYSDDNEATKTVYKFDENWELTNSHTEEVDIYAPVENLQPSTENIIQNLLTNHSFEKGLSGWNTTSATNENFNISNADDKIAYIGKSALCIYGNNIQPITPVGVFQQTETLTAGEYTFSAYMRASAVKESHSPIGFIRVKDSSGNVIAISETVDKYDSEYCRLTATFKLDSNKAVKTEIMFYGSGYIYADAVQLEKGEFAHDYNMLENSDFSRDTDDWSGATYSTEHYFTGSRSLKVSNEQVRAFQTLNCNSDKSTRETFTVSGWAKAPEITGRIDSQYAPEAPCVFYVRMDLYYVGGGSEGTGYVLSRYTNDWQYFELKYAKKNYKEVERITVFCEYTHNPGSAYFDNLILVRNSIETGLKYEDFEDKSDYATATASAEENGQSYTPVPTSEGAESEVNTEESFEALSPTFEEAFDNAGNPLTETTFEDGEFGTIYRSFGYDSAKNNLVHETDSMGFVTSYEVNETTSRNEAVTDRLGNKTEYEYDILGRTTKVTSKRADDTELANVSYSYDEFDNLTEIARGDGMKYNLNYNSFHELESIGIEGKEENLIHYTYKNAGGKVKEIEYANGDKMTATYNGKGELIAEKWYDSSNTLTAHYKYTYDDKGNMLRSIDILSLKEYDYTYSEDRITRSTEYDITVSEDFFVTLKILINSIRYFYNEDGELTCKRVCPVGADEQVIYFEKGENESEILKSEIAHQKYLSHSKTDNFGRKIFEEVQFGKGFTSRRFDYLVGEVTQEHDENGKIKSSPTTQLVSKITLSNGRTLEYFYDAEERIKEVKDSETGTTFYSYDALGQLTCETVNDTVKNVMLYDNYGNIRNKNGVEYIYDTVWKDKLVRVGNKTISYDAQGNPLTYLGHNLTWEKGRQLKSFDLNTYTYNANGIRTSKYVKATDSVHKYILDGTKILREEWVEYFTSMGVVGADSYYIEPIYDNEDTVTGINFCGDVYFFNKNLQGDIIEIVNAYSGKTVAKYSYDAWGKCTIDPDSIDTVIAERNPFRYRGYYYDQETDLYYLQSRYYDANTGRFVNGDMVEFAVMQQGIVEHNLFAYCGNDAINYIDCFGYAPLTLFKTSKEAVKDFAYNYYNISLYIRMELSSVLYSIQKNRKVYYSYTPYTVGHPHYCNPLASLKWIPKGGFCIGAIHTHPNSNVFSNSDKNWAKKSYRSIYVITPNRNIRVYHDTRRGWKDEILFKNMIFKKLNRDISSRLRYQYRSLWNSHIKTKCDFNCIKKGWPGNVL